jgi:YVTN family beta-propeller protein
MAEVADDFERNGDKKINEAGLAHQASLSEESCNNAESPERQFITFPNGRRSPAEKLHARCEKLSMNPQKMTGKVPAGLVLLAFLLSGCRRPGFPGYPAGFQEFAYVANAGSNTVTVLDLVYLRPDRTLSVGEHPAAIARNPVRDEIYVLNTQPGSANGSVSVVDTAANQVAATISVRRGPTSISVERTGKRAYVANTGANSISVIDLEARRTLGVFGTGANPGSALISPDGRTLVVTHAATGVIDLYAAGAPTPAKDAAPEPVLQFRASFAGCPGATSPVILPDSSKAFVACPAVNGVLALSLAAEPDSWAAKQDPSLMADHALALLEVGQDPTEITLKPDGGEVFVSNTGSGSISEISTTSNEVGNTFPIGDRPGRGAISADNGALWVAMSGADAVSLYSIDDGKLLTSLHTGAGPGAMAFSADKEQKMLLVADRTSGDVSVIRTTGSAGPALFTMLPAGAEPSAMVVESKQKLP